MHGRIKELLISRGRRRGGGAFVVGVLAGGERIISTWSARTITRPDEHTVFEIGSLTKPFTGSLLADMHLRGELALADRLSRHLPSADAPRWRGGEPTLEQLATHTSGLPNTPRGMLARELAVVAGLRREDPWTTVDERAYRSLVRRSTPRRPFGRRGVRYSSLGFGLLGEALARRAGRPFGELLRDRLFEPLGMRDSAVIGPSSIQGRSRRGRPRPEIHDWMLGGGAIRSTAADLLRWLVSCERPPADAPGPALDLAQRPRVRAGRKISIGLGWIILRERRRPPIVWHNGATYGFRSFAAFVPGRGVAVVALSNTSRSLERLGFALVHAAVDEEDH